MILLCFDDDRPDHRIGLHVSLTSAAARAQGYARMYDSSSCNVKVGFILGRF